ncbi:MAG: hypothetical protein H7141_13755 [Burkholderiales bacterium]|nr:hypothetical protein [Bacteroidia bacterium]
MNKLLLFSILFVLSFNWISAQITVKNAKKLETKLRNQHLYVVISDTSLKKLYKKALEGITIFDSVFFISEKRFESNIQPNNCYLSSMRFFSIYGTNGNYRLMNYLMIFSPGQKSVEEFKYYHFIKLQAVDEYAFFPIELKKIGNGFRPNFGVLRNNFQQLSKSLDLDKDLKYNQDFSNSNALSALKHDTLLVVLDDVKDTATINLFSKNYPYKYAFISNEAHEKKILTSGKSFYYMHFSLPEENFHNQISIVNSATGLEVFHEKIMVMNNEYEISDKRLFILIDKINGL